MLEATFRRSPRIHSALRPKLACGFTDNTERPGSHRNTPPASAQPSNQHNHPPNPASGTIFSHHDGAKPPLNS